jgi:eukaryotic-like serine/threonine-protein kinase
MDNEWSQDGGIPALSGLSTAAMERLDSVCLRFEAAWQQARQPVLEDYLHQVPEQEMVYLLFELVKIDLHYRRQAGERITAADYPSHFPQYRLALERFELQAGGSNYDTAEHATAANESTDPGKQVVPSIESAAELPTPCIPGYEFGPILGRGAMGTVYLARQIAVNRQVAVKTILMGKLAGDDATARFLSEAEAAAALQHPNIVQIFELGRHCEQPYIALEYVAGGSLAHKLKKGTIPPRIAARLVEQLARGVNAAHLTGIIHRDLKPSNILLSPDGTAKVTDFGLAKRLQNDGDLTQIGIVVGTPTYMAPEQALGKRVGPAADIYALGVILYECLTGRPPFKSDTILETMRRVVEEDPTPLRKLNPRVPHDLQSICLKCLNKQPQKRYPSAEALADDLRCWQENKPVKARPAGSIEKTAKWLRRRPAFAALALALFIMLVAGLWWSGEQARREAGLAARRNYINKEVAAAIDEADSGQRQLTDRLDDPLRVQEFLSDLSKWQRDLDRIQADLRRAETLAAGDPELVSSDSIDRLDARRRQLWTDVQSYQLAVRLDSISLGTFQASDGPFQKQAFPDRDYASALEKAGLATGSGIPPPALAEVVKRSPVRHALVAALDLHAMATRDTRLKANLLEVVLLADPDSWRDQVRDPRSWHDPTVLQRLATEADVARQSPRILVTLGGLLAHNKIDAMPLLRRSLLAHPQDFWLLYAMAFYSKESPEAVAYYQAALAIRPTNIETLQSLGGALLAIKDGQGATACFKKVLELNDKHAPALLGLGNVLMEQRDIKGAKSYFEKAIHLVPDFAKAHNSLGVALYAGNDLAGAFACYEKALQYDSHYPPTYNNLGNVLKAKGDREGAIANYKKAIEHNPEYAEAYCNLGLLLFESKEMAAAVECYKKSVACNPSFAQGHYNLGVALFEMENAAGAVTAFERAVICDPNNAQAHNNLGVALRRQQNLPAAVAAFEKAVACDSNWAIAHNNLGGVLFAMHQAAPAIAAFKKAVACDPGYAVAHCNLGNALYAQGDKSGALASYRKALAADPSDALAHSLVGQLLRERGDFAEALRELKTGHKLGSRQPGWFDPSGLSIKQCEELLTLDEKLTRILKSEGHADGAEEQLALANLCLTYKSHYVDAVGFFTAAFSAEPNLISNVRKSNRYNAACAAALASSGAGKDASRLDVAARLKLRQRTQEWLRADLELWQVMARSEEPMARQYVIQQLSQWQADPRLASIREAKPLELLPELERTSWRQLWLSVADLIQKSKSGV